jgi:hypothetical protein
MEVGLCREFAQPEDDLLCLLTKIDPICIYSNRSIMKDLGILRFVSQFSEGFNFYVFS